MLAGPARRLVLAEHHALHQRAVPRQLDLATMAGAVGADTGDEGQDETEHPQAPGGTIRMIATQRPPCCAATQLATAMPRKTSDSVIASAQYCTALQQNGCSTAQAPRRMPKIEAF